MNSIVLQKALSVLEFNTSLVTNAVNPNLLATRGSTASQNMISDISGMQSQSFLAFTQA